MRTVLIVEPDENGHRLYYVNLIAKESLAGGDSVVLALKNLDSESVRTHLGDILSSVSLRQSPDSRLSTVVALSKEVRADITVVPDGDRLAYEVGIRGGWRGLGDLSILVMRDPSLQAARGKRGIMLRARRHLLRRAMSLSRVRIRILRSAVWSGTEVVGVRDPVNLTPLSSEAVDEVRRSVGLVDGHYWFAILGAISARKNLELVAESVVSVRGGALLIAGRVDPDAMVGARAGLDMLRTRGVPVVVIDRLLTDRELDGLVIAADCIVLAHSNEGPSGLLGKAVRAGTRVVCAGASSLRRDASDVPEVAQWAPLNTAELSKALEVAAGSPRPSPGLTGSESEFAASLI